MTCDQCRLLPPDQRWPVVVLLTAAVAAYLLWLVQYSRIAPWWQNMLGRHQVIASGMVEIFLIVLLVFVGAPSWRPVTGWLFVAASGGLAFMMLWRLIIWSRVEDAARARAAAPPPGPGEDEAAAR